MKTRKNLISESGAIMLEVVAVLSLMGLMGTMLFRQMYVRNQELHNIQMASEIRVVKDAFAAWIQAQSSRLGATCAVSNDLNLAEVCPLPPEAINDIKNFLPEGYFSNEGGVAIDRGNVLKDNFILKLVGYRRGTAASNILTYYGVVIPDPSILPDQGETDNGSWNFRRAARVAMLIGIDGGAYDPTITGDEIAGAVGTWHLPINGLIENANRNIPTYVAITGTDVFQPEIDVPPVRIGLPEHWNLALQDATAYGKFTAGAPDGCYLKEMDAGQRVAVYNSASGIFEIRPDHINEPSATCLPAFYVESGDDGNKATGNVHVLNDLTVGRDWTGANAGKAAIRFDKDGMIVFEKDEVADPQNPGKKVNYMLDPQYTSVMNDIKIMSRGGARLSDILPNYILKDITEMSCVFGENKRCSGAATSRGMVSSTHTCQCRNPSVEDDVLDIYLTYPQCPNGYGEAVVITPESGIGSYGKDGGGISDTTNGIWVENNASPPEKYQIKTGNNHSLRVIQDIGVGTLMVKIEEEAANNRWKITPTYEIYDAYWTQTDGHLRKITTRFKMHRYCVFDPTNIDWNSDGTADGADNSPDKNRTMNDTVCGRIKAQSVCENMGCAWNATTNVCGEVAAGP